MESTVNMLLPYAIACLEESHVQEPLADIYESYLAQFGPMVVQLEIPCALAVYLNKNENSKGNRGQVIKWIHTILSRASFIANSQRYDVWARQLMQQPPAGVIEELILDASIALKRAIRTFPLVKSEKP